MNTREIARELVDMGYVIFPIEPDGKLPLVRWATESSYDLEEITSWWDDYPDDNIGINCGESGLLVVDLDSASALDEFHALWKKHEHKSLSEWDGPVIRTRRGWHLYFDEPSGKLGNTASKLGYGVDTRGNGGMVLAAGSVVSGVTYVRAAGNLRSVPAVPDWLHLLLKPKPPRDYRELMKLRKLSFPLVAQAELRKHCRRVELAADGEQNTRINQAAYFLARDAMPPLDPDVVRGELMAAAERGNHPRYRARATIESGLSQGMSYDPDSEREKMLRTIMLGIRAGQRDSC